MKKLLLGLSALLLLAAGGLTLYVASIDWNQHKGAIASRFEEATGKKIEFSGPVALKFLPSPSLSATNVKIFNPGSPQPLVEIRDLVASLALSPLLKGNIDVKRMVLVDPKIYVEADAEGRLNWQQDLTAEERAAIETAPISLNSVSLQNATLHFEMPSQNISRQLNNLNGEIIAQSIMGPFRIEGNYISGKNPEGFAISVGKLSESFATTLNLVFTHPTSESYIRFDGSFLLSNKVLNGNVIIESKKLREFVNANIHRVNLPEAYDYPLALTFDLAANEQQLNFANIVLKYGETQGAGSMQIPLNVDDTEEVFRPQVEAAFNLTDFNLNPAVYTIREFFNKYRKPESSYQPEFPFDLMLDLKSLKTTYNDQPVKNFELSLDLMDDTLTLNSLTATLPGETDLQLKGDLESEEGQPFYNLDLSFNASDFLKTLTWLGIKPPVSAASTYRKAMGTARLSGTFDRIQISPFTLTVDKSSLGGEAGLKWGPRPDLMLVLNADAVNFDNYIGTLSVEQQKQSWAQRLQYRFARLALLNDFDMQLNAKFDLVIYENMPFEKVSLQINLLDKAMEIKQLQINSVANAQWEFSGMLKGFGGVPQFENLKYAVKTNDLAALINKLEFKAPNLNYSKLKNFESRGIATGSPERFATKTVSKAEQLDFAFAGQMLKKPEGYDYIGSLEAKHPDFVQMLNELNLPYDPQTYSLGLFNLKTKFVGNLRQFKANPLEVHIGFNNFKGELNFDGSGARPNILTTLTINQLETERFIHKSRDAAKMPAIQPETPEAADFLAKPYWNRNKFDYSFLKKFDLSGQFNIGSLSYKQYTLQDALAAISINDSVLNIEELKGRYKEAPLTGRLSLNAKDTPNVSGSLEIENISAADLNWSGSRYGLIEGKARLKLTANAPAESTEAVVSGLTGKAELAVDAPVIKGWNLPVIYEDITQRQVPDGLAAVVKANLESGSTSFSALSATADFKDGGFSISEGELTGSGLKVSLMGDGNLPGWEMNMLFNLKYDEPRWLPGYSFALKGPINAPIVDVNVSALHNLYKSRQDQVNAQVRAAEEAETLRLKQLVGEQQKAAEVLRDQLRKELQPEIERLSKSAQSEAAIAQLREIEQKSQQLQPQISAILTKAAGSAYSDALALEMAAENERAAASLENLRKEFAIAQLTEEKFRTKDTYEKLVENYNRGKLSGFNFNNSYNKFKNRLDAVVTDFNFDEDANILGWKQFNDDKVALLNDQNQQLMNRYMEMQKSTDLKAITEYNQELAALEVRVAEDVAALEEGLDSFRAYAEEKVAAEEKTYADKLRQEEVQRKLEENTGVINIKKTGRSVKVQRGIEEIEKSEELTAQEKVKVLDFSKPQEENPPAPALQTPAVKKGRVIRK